MRVDTHLRIGAVRFTAVRSCVCCVHTLLARAVSRCLLEHGVKIKVKPPNQNLDLNFLSQKTSRHNRQLTQERVWVCGRPPARRPTRPATEIDIRESECEIKPSNVAPEAGEGAVFEGLGGIVTKRNCCVIGPRPCARVCALRSICNYLDDDTTIRTAANWCHS